MTWTDAVEAEVIERWNAGESGGQIALDMGISRSAILGKLHRLKHHHQSQITRHKMAHQKGTKRRHSPLKPAFRPAAPPRMAPAAEPLLLAPIDDLPRMAALEVEAAPAPPGEPEFLAIDILELGLTSCRWPDDGRPVRFCGATRKEDSPYCAFHHQRAHQGPHR